jgi:cell division septal protein FtsQ
MKFKLKDLYLIPLILLMLLVWIISFPFWALNEFVMIGLKTISR